MTVYRGCVLHSLDPTSIELLPRGLLFVNRGGRIERLEPETDGAGTRGEKVVDLGDRLILPGLVDAHLHIPQVDIVGIESENLIVTRAAGPVGD